MTRTHPAPTDRAARATAPDGRWSRWPALLGVLVLAALTGAATAVTVPLGPTTTGQAALVMVLGALLGLAVGRGTGAVWTVLPTAAVHLTAVELGRLAVAVPTVDAVRLDSLYGVLALLAGRGVHTLLLLLPMLLGARIGRVPPVPHPVRRRLGTAVLGLVVVALAVLLAVPASTPAVGPAGLATLESVTLSGTEHALMIRAADVDDPVLLYLSGGPGQSDLALARVLSAPWTDDVVFATFDQRGNGKSYAGLLPADRATLDRAVADTIALSEQLRDRFGEEKIYLMGESWGTLLGVLAVQRRPDLYHAWIGSGQMVDVQETDRRIYTDLQTYASRTGDAELAATLDRIGPPPYRDIPWANAVIMGAYDHLYGPYTPSEGYLARGEASGLDPFGLLGTEYDVMEKANVLRGLIDTFTVMYPQLQGLDLRRTVPALEVPVYVLDGAAELRGRRDLMLEWYGRLDAPEKHLITFDGAAHSVAFEQADEVHRLLTDVILPRAGHR